MNKKCLAQSILALFILFFVVGCAKQVPPMKIPSFQAKQFSPMEYEPKVNNFLIIMDTSRSMKDPYGGIPKFEIAKLLVSRLNMTIPEMDQIAAFRTFGHHDPNAPKTTELFLGMRDYSREKMDKSIARVQEPYRDSPTASAMVATLQKMARIPGQKAIVLISDGLGIGETIETIEGLKAKHGNQLCVYPVQIGDSSRGMRAMTKLAEMDGCGFVTQANDILGSEGMGVFVETVFLKTKDAAMLDTDGDGIVNSMDECPETPEGAMVNPVGCWIINSILFDFDKSIIKPKAFPLLNTLSVIMKENPNMRVKVHGHTDNRGSQEYNLGLSMRRANAVAAYLVKRGVSKQQLEISGFGFKKPIAKNTTGYGRSKNRRVEIIPITSKTMESAPMESTPIQ